MNNIFLVQLNKISDNKPINIPTIDNTRVSASEKLVRKEIDKLNDNTEQLKKLRKQIEKSEQKK